MKPILFNTEMVRAILDNRKTVTRRVVKFLPGFNPKWTGYVPDGSVLYGSNNIPAAKSPYRPGDILYVRETWCDIWDEDEWWCGYGYAADGDPNTDYWGIFRNGFPIKSFKWHPSIHMPREAARIFLRVTGVRVERLQDMSNADAQKEGCDGRGFGPSSGTDGTLCTAPYDFSIERFQTVWDSTIKPADRALYGWDANPCVRVIEFERCEKSEGVRIE